jgi:NADH dehydrogenase
MNGKTTPRVVIVGAGFGGLTAARALARAPAHITVIDRKNHHTFQPLLYQVATAGLSPSEIAAPIRSILRGRDGIEVLLGEVTGFDLARRVVETPEQRIPYDYLVVAAGASHAYFGHDDWEPFAPGLKTIEDALEIRRRVLLAFELAERQAAAGESRERWLKSAGTRWSRSSVRLIRKAQRSFCLRVVRGFFPPIPRNCRAARRNNCSSLASRSAPPPW